MNTSHFFPTLRVARATDDLEALLPFYRDGLGMEVLYHFEDHGGFDGVMLGATGAPYHFEFTHARGHNAGRAPNPDALLVFYIGDRGAWQAAVDRMGRAGFSPVPAFNPYWDRLGRTFEDPDGYRVVLQKAEWKAYPTPGFASLRDHIAFYAGAMDECLVDWERVTPQPGGFYGGWVTSKVAGPFNGLPGSRFW